MAIHVALHHKTRYVYDRPVALGPQVVRLRPAPHSRTRILSYSMRVQPEAHFLNWQQDPQSNHQARLTFPEKTKEFSVEIDLVAEMAVHNPFDFFLEPGAENFPFHYDPQLDHELEPFRHRIALSPKFTDYLASIRRDLIGHAYSTLMEGHRLPQTVSERGGDLHAGGVLPVAGTLPPVMPDSNRPRTIDFLVGINQRLWKDIRYLIRMEPGVQTPEQTLTNLSGSCRDSSWLLCQLLRHCGLAARFVSGYLIQLKPDVKSIDGPSGAEKDFTDLHAWCEVYLPGAGWIGLDPTSGLLAGEGHVPLAATPDPSSAAPISGLVGPAKCDFSFEMSVARIHESPRVTKPYTSSQWAEIQALGHAVDLDLATHDVRLTMGGEPTFVSIDDPDGAEWNVAALGPKKRVLGDELLRRLQRRFASGALLHHGQGRAYPGEVLPRWAFACYWRRDGHPIWENPSLVANETTQYGHSSVDSDRFIRALARRLMVDPQWVMPALEDSFHGEWKNRRLPSNAPANPVEADRVVGHVLPLQRGWKNCCPVWSSGPWFLKSEKLFLFPGDSAMGFRLPLDSLPWVSSSDYPYIVPLDPAVPRSPLPLRAGFQEAYKQIATPAREQAAAQRRLGQTAEQVQQNERNEDTTRRPAPGESAAWIVRTAVCAEPRGGRLHVFMPPMATLEDYLELVTAVEDTAGELDLPVLLEGYTPPADPRINVLKVTPDPGVIEVNMHPTSTWDEIVEQTTTLYEEARQARLGTEKFMMDGRHTGTGGGNHIVLGGATPQDSPLLRRPDLLKSLVTYWQNHPSLSYLFSGLSIGPTSQSPRVDEARNDSLYELEVAFRELKRHCLPEIYSEEASGKFRYPVPWLVDRLFRNLLIDSTGNTHRAEFCIDKLYSPDSSAGRLGLLEMRAFEMPPHAEMSLAQQLLLRTLVARFWRQPYEAGLVRWGTQIHDRWMLPHFVWEDLKEVLEELKGFGYDIRPEWFAPHFEFRFPLHGEVGLQNVSLEIRHALEPWHVLGEEGSAGGNVRYVDSSLERLQVKVSGMTEARHLVTCNGVAIPLHPTGTHGGGVAGVRYRAWQPASCLHPTIGVHSPLVFDVVDTWNERSIGGCTYHVMHPGGRNYSTFPINACEAESRRLARFFRQGHTPGTIRPKRAQIDPEFPTTLDLRLM